MSMQNKLMNTKEIPIIEIPELEVESESGELRWQCDDSKDVSINGDPTGVDEDRPTIDDSELDKLVGAAPAIGIELTGGFTITETYSYTDHRSMNLYDRIYFVGPDGQLGDTFAYPLTGDWWLWSRDRVTLSDDGLYHPTDDRIPLVMFNLPEIRRAEEVYVVPNERDVLALEGLGITATCSPTGTGRFRLSFIETILWKNVVLVPGSDVASRRTFARLARRLTSIRKRSMRRDASWRSDSAEQGYTVKMFGLPYGAELDGLANYIERKIQEQQDNPNPEEAVAVKLRNAVKDTKVWEPDYSEDYQPLVHSVRSFPGGASRQHEFLIDGILPVGGKMTFSAPAKWSKSWFAMQFGLALASGNCTFLGWEMGDPRRVLYMQVELQDSMVRRRMDILLERPPEGLDIERAQRNMFVPETRDWRPELSSDEGRRMLQAIIDRIEPDVLIIDPFSFAFPGMSENAAESMGEALSFLGELTTENQIAVVLIHHHGKNGSGARGSSVFEAWPDTDMQATLVEEDERETGSVALRLRCAPNDGPLYWRMPKPERMWFELMPEEWEPPKNKGGKQAMELDLKQVQTLCAQHTGGLGRGALEEAIRETMRIGQVSAKNAVRNALEAGLIVQDRPHGPYKAAPAPQRPKGIRRLPQ